MNRDIAKGKFEQLKGKAKQSVGEAIGNEHLANSGAADEVKGAAKEAWGNIKDDGAARSQTTAHDIREKITSTAQNVKSTVSPKSEDFKHRRSA
jgi:uncharacterized protein YjbJ (UPF0337 family)